MTANSLRATKGAHNQRSVFYITLKGPLSVSDNLGNDFTPRGGKECAMLALLFTHDRFVRSRNWIKSMLWSDSSPEAASSNLRQTLWRLRKHFSDDEGLIQSNKLNIWADMDRVKVLKNSNPGSVFLEGMDVPDDAFEDWLREIREQDILNCPQSSRLHCDREDITLRTKISHDGHNDHRTAAFDYLNGKIMQWGVKLSDSSASEQNTNLQAGSILGAGQPLLHLNFMNADFMTAHLRNSYGQCVWSFMWPRSQSLSGQEFEALDNMVLALLPALARVQETPISEALNLFFSRNINHQQRAQSIFLDASESSALARCWYAYSLVVGNAEKIRDGEFFQQSIVIENLRKSLEAEPYNAIINALTGHLYSFVFRDFQKSDHYLSLARRIDPTNKLALTFSATNANYSDRPEEALHFAQKASQIAGLPALDFLISTSRLSTLSLLGRFDEAIKIGESVLLEQPNFLGARRYLTSCYHHAGKMRQRDEMIYTTQKLDPEFTSDGIRQPLYPLPSRKSVDLLADAFSK